MPTDTSPARSNRVLAAELVIASFLVLFQELTLIRWAATQVRVISYFPNVILLSAFLGLGIGCLRAKTRSLLWFWPVSLLVLAVSVFFMGNIVFTQSTPTEHLWLLYYDLPRTAFTIRSIEFPILVTFVLSALTFVSLGQVVAVRLQAFSERGNPLLGYSYDLTGSLLGVIAFAAVSISGLRPVYWFAAIGLLGAVFFVRQRWGAALYAALVGVVLFLAGHMDHADAYSPYYALRKITHPGDSAVSVLTNGSIHQVALEMNRAAPSMSEYNTVAREGYHLPYSLMKPGIKSALVLGSGTGNDVAVMLDEGVEHIDAVEIDPVILKWGALHPDNPYASPRVTAHNTDARSFLNNSQRKYDLIVFGTLDSQTRLSALSSVRLDNFVYTRETIVAAKKLLNPDGGLVLYFLVSSDYIGLRIAGMLTEAFGEMPLTYIKHHKLFSIAFMSGKAFAHQRTPDLVAQGETFKNNVLPNLDLPCDDWPYLYLEQRRVGSFYLLIMAAIAALSVIGVFASSEALRKAPRQGGFIDGEMFLFGLAFLLMETRSVTALNLIWGATWLTSAVVFGAVLLMALCATLVAKARAISFKAAVLGLAVSLLAAYAIPIDMGLSYSVALKLIFSLITVGTPIFFASLGFAALFKTRTDADHAFGWNLLGAVFGGLLEFFSMSVGLKALLLIALVAYMLAALLWVRRQKQPAPEAATPAAPVPPAAP